MSKLNMKAALEQLDNLNQGDVVIVSGREVEGGKISIEVAELLRKAPGAVGFFNASDERFDSKQKPVRGWITITPSDFFGALQGMTLEEYEAIAEEKHTRANGDTVMVRPLGLKNPKFTADGATYIGKLQVVENHLPRNSKDGTYQQPAKEDGNGNILLKNGRPIYRHVTLELGQVEHIYLKHDDMVNKNGEPVQITGAAQESFA